MNWLIEHAVNFLINQVVKGPLRLGQMFRLGVEYRKLHLPQLQRQVYIKIGVPLGVCLSLLLVVMIWASLWLFVIYFGLLVLFVVGYFNVTVDEEMKQIQEARKNMDNSPLNQPSFFNSKLPGPYSRHLWLGLAIVFLALGIVGVVFLPQNASTTPPPAPPTAPPPAPTPPAPMPQTKTWQWKVPANAEDVDTHVQIHRGQMIQFFATGQVNGSSTPGDAAYGWSGPDGRGSLEFNYSRKSPLPGGSSFMALCYRIGKGHQAVDDGEWHLAGSSSSYIADSDGTLHFTVNDPIVDESGKYRPEWRTDNQGFFSVKVTVQ